MKTKNIVMVLQASAIAGALIAISVGLSGCSSREDYASERPSSRSTNPPPESQTEGAPSASSGADWTTEGMEFMVPPKEGFRRQRDDSAAKAVGKANGVTSGEFRNSGALTGYSQTPQSTPPIDPRYLPSRDEELWVIARFNDEAAQTPTDDRRWGLLCHPPHRTEEVALPLKHTAVEARVDGYIATVDVTQQFFNPYDGKIEAVYVFPLPENAAINEFVMTIGERRIRGIIREREEAEEIYQAAKEGGYRASLMTQERPNIFTQSVANIEPLTGIDIRIKYFNTLAYDDGWYEFVFPMVVGPRYNPAGSDGIGAVRRGQQGASGQSTEVQYLKPGERSGHDIALNLDIRAGVSIEEIDCPTHAVRRQQLGEDRAIVSLEPRDTLPNKDFVLRYRVVGESIKSGLITHRDERGGYFSLMVYPPASLARLPRQPMEMIFVIDCSGSMNGEPIKQAKDAILHALDHLEPNDTFQVIQFSNNHSQLASQPLAANASNLRRARDYVRGLNGSGGTDMIQGIRAALNFDHHPDRLRFVTFLTDGFIGNEAEILGELRRRLGASRVFSFGVGSSPNRSLMDSMAKLGRGAVAYLNSQASGSEVMDRFFARVSHPALTDIRIDWGNLDVSEVYPQETPDLFVGRPLILTGRFRDDRATSIRITGHTPDRDLVLTIPAEPVTTENHEGLPCIWARRKIADLSDAVTWKRVRDFEGQVKRLALDYSLMSPYTAFVAVDGSRRTAGNVATTVPMAVPVPEGTRYNTTVEN